MFQTIDDSWTLFLDRDGVINRRLDDDYVKKITEFEFLEGSLEAIAQLAKLFSRIFVVTNQQGIGKNGMTEHQLTDIHDFMQQKIIDAGGRIDAIYYCPHLKMKRCDCRKPSPGMAWQAKKDFPNVDFQKSMMVGDTVGDMKFGKAVGMATVFIDSNQDVETIENEALIDFCYPSLLDFAQKIKA